MENNNYPPDVLEAISIMDTYHDDENESVFNLFHLYPDGIAYPKGYYDSQFFILHGFNFKNKTKRNLGRHDGLEIGRVPVDIVRIFVDGSTLMRFSHAVTVDLYQCVSVYRA